MLLALAILGCGSYDWCARLNLDCATESSARTPVVDQDNDVWSVPDDCDDTRADVYPGALELCDGADNDCDGDIDEDLGQDIYRDSDGDGFGDPDDSDILCEGVLSGWVSNGLDCADDDPASFPGAPERCDGGDNDCDGVIDEGVALDFYTDADGDGYGTGDSLGQFCPSSAPEGSVRAAGDCDDSRADVSPGRDELCADALDNNCDGTVDEAGSCLATGAWLYRSVASAQVGYAVAGGDVSGDGVDDLLVGAPYLTTTSGQEGAAYLQSGPITADTDLSGAQATLLGDLPVSYAGLSVSVVDDVNADGFAEILVGLPFRAEGAASYAGTALLFLGPLTGTLDVASASAAFPGTSKLQRQGWSLTAPGDINDDGVPDLAVVDLASTQTIRLYSGTTQGTASQADALATLSLPGVPTGQGRSFDRADINGDGLVDLLVGDGAAFSSRGTFYGFYGPLSGEVVLLDADVQRRGTSAVAQLGYSIASAGDADGDGYADVVVGLPYLNAAASRVGGAALLTGPLDGDSVLVADVLWSSAIPSDNLGTCVDSAGDTDGDGRDEVVLLSGQLQASGASRRIGVYLLDADTPGTYDVIDAALVRQQLNSPGTGTPTLLGGLDPSGDGRLDVVVGLPGYADFGVQAGGVRILEIGD